jgi:uncharacterized protein (TIGR03067 family)
MTHVRPVLVVVLLLGCVAAGADEPKKADPKDPPKAKEPVRLDIKALGEMLSDMGYKPELTDKDTFQKIQVTTSKDGTFSIWLSISASKQFVWLYTSFTLPDGFEKAPPASWRKLLEKNDDIGPALFSVDEPGKRLVLRQPLGNANITPVQLRKAITGYVGIITQNKHLWNRANFLPEMTAEAKKVLDGLDGTWKVTEAVSMGKAVAAEEAAKINFVFDKGTLTAGAEGQMSASGLMYIQIKDGVVWFDMYAPQGTDYGILKVDVDTLTMCLAQERPTEFVSTEKGKSTLFVLKRQKK